MPDELQALADKIKAMSPPDRLRLAADLLERKSARLAAQIAGTVVDEIRLGESALRLREAFGPGARMGIGPKDGG